MANSGREPVQKLTPEKFLTQKQDAEPQAPEDKVPCRAVPEARQEPDDDDIEDVSPLAGAVAAQRNVDIIAKPRGQRYMPALPEAGD